MQARMVISSSCQSTCLCVFCLQAWVTLPSCLTFENLISICLKEGPFRTESTWSFMDLVAHISPKSWEHLNYSKAVFSIPFSFDSIIARDVSSNSQIMCSALSRLLVEFHNFFISFIYWFINYYFCLVLITMLLFVFCCRSLFSSFQGRIYFYSIVSHSVSLRSYFELFQAGCNLHALGLITGVLSSFGGFITPSFFTFLLSLCWCLCI